MQSGQGHLSTSWTQMRLSVLTRANLQLIVVLLLAIQPSSWGQDSSWWGPRPPGFRSFAEERAGCAGHRTSSMAEAMDLGPGVTEEVTVQTLSMN